MADDPRDDTLRAPKIPLHTNLAHRSIARGFAGSSAKGFTAEPPYSYLNIHSPNRQTGFASPFKNRNRRVADSIDDNQAPRRFDRQFGDIILEQ
jgi:hypothetical protein